jgi:hypothetical protein
LVVRGLVAEQWTHSTPGSADVILANSRFTTRVVARHMRSIARDINIVYPGINVEAYKPLEGMESNEVYS